MSRANDMAYPVESTVTTPNSTVQNGLTIREHFALEIFKGYVAGGLAYGNWDSARGAAIGQADLLIAELAKAKECADAMSAALKGAQP